MENGQVVIRKRGIDRIRQGHLWVYRSDVLRADAAPGNIVSVQDERGNVLGKAFYSSKSQIALRFLARSGGIVIDEKFFRQRFELADRLRQQLGVDPLLSRRVYSEGDFLPGLIVDRYHDCLVIQSLIQGTDAIQPLIIDIVSERYRPSSILFRNDSRVRELEGLELKQEVVGEPLPETMIVDEDGKKLAVSLAAGQKTGSYLDQRDNHRAARRYARGRALDAFAYGGGFAIQIAERCDYVEAVDISATAVDLIRANADRNGLNIEAIEANAFDFLRERHREGAQYDTIILDPPAFAKNKESLEAALRGYKEINNRAMRLMRSGGVLITCSCSHHVHEGLFAEMLAAAAKDAGCWARVLERRVQSSDHPILLSVPETLYLKCFILEILY